MLKVDKSLIEVPLSKISRYATSTLPVERFFFVQELCETTKELERAMGYENCFKFIIPLLQSLSGDTEEVRSAFVSQIPKITEFMIE
jgi:hypothetical protein